MNIEKIKNYNQKMLALLSTLLVIVATIGLISFIIFLISELIPTSYPNDPNRLLSDEKVNELKKDSLRQQIISYDQPYLVDTLNLTYLIKVSVKTLDKPERIEKNIFPTVSKLESGNSDQDYFISDYFYGSFNNLLVFDYPLNKTVKVCDARLVGSDLSYKFLRNEIIIAFKGAQEDTNNDGEINGYDLQSLYLYSLTERKLR